MIRTNEDDCDLPTPAQYGVELRRWLRDRPAPNQDEPSPKIPLRNALAQERAAITQVRNMLLAVADVLLYSDDDDGEMHSSVVQVSARLLEESGGRLQAIESTLPDTEVPTIT